MKEHGQYLGDLLPCVLFPLREPQVSCGNRLDLPKKQRRHKWIPLGTDIRHKGPGGTCIERLVYACMRCGKDCDKSIPGDR